MYRKHFRHTRSNRNRNFGRGRRNGWRGFGPGWAQEGGWGPGPQGRGFGPGRGWASDEAGPDFGPPPWAPRWGWSQEAPEEAPSEGTFPWGRGRWWGATPEISDEEKRVWLEAQKARLRAWQEHLSARLAEIEQALTDTETAEDAN